MWRKHNPSVRRWQQENGGVEVTNDLLTTGPITNHPITRPTSQSETGEAGWPVAEPPGGIACRNLPRAMQVSGLSRSDRESSRAAILVLGRLGQDLIAVLAQIVLK